LLTAFIVEPFDLFVGPRRKQSVQKLKALQQFPPDPRLARLARAHLETFPARTREVLTRLCELLIAAKAPDAKTVIEGLIVQAPARKKWLGGLLARAEDRPMAPCSAEGLAELIDQNAVAPRFGQKAIESLLTTVYEEPDNDAPRLVLADALLEIGDVRGEYMSLVFTPEKQIAANTLLQEIRAGWLAPWSAFIAIDLVEFERGFPVSAMFIDVPPRLDASMRTLRSIVIACDEASFAFEPELSSVRRVDARVPVLIRAPKKSVEWAHLALASGDDASSAVVFGRLATMPRLESLVLDGVGPSAVGHATRWLETYRGHVELAFIDAAACGAVVAAALTSPATLKFRCPQASIRGSVKRGSLSLRVASTSPERAQRAFVKALPQHFAALEFDAPEVAAGAEWPAAFVALKPRATLLTVGAP